MLVHERIRAIIKASGVKQVTLAQKLGEPEYYVSDRLTGRVKLMADEIQRFADALEISPCDFFEEAPREPSEHDQRVAAIVVQAGQEMPDERTYAMFTDFMQWMTERGWRPPEGSTE